MRTALHVHESSHSLHKNPTLMPPNLWVRGDRTYRLFLTVPKGPAKLNKTRELCIHTVCMQRCVHLAVEGKRKE